jgi:hypothetical protein
VPGWCLRGIANGSTYQPQAAIMGGDRHERDQLTM